MTKQLSFKISMEKSKVGVMLASLPSYCFMLWILTRYCAHVHMNRSLRHGPYGQYIFDTIWKVSEKKNRSTCACIYRSVLIRGFMLHGLVMHYFLLTLLRVLMDDKKTNATCSIVSYLERLMHFFLANMLWHKNETEQSMNRGVECGKLFPMPLYGTLLVWIRTLD